MCFSDVLLLVDDAMYILWLSCRMCCELANKTHLPNVIAVSSHVYWCDCISFPCSYVHVPLTDAQSPLHNLSHTLSPHAHASTPTLPHLNALTHHIHVSTPSHSPHLNALTYHTVTLPTPPHPHYPLTAVPGLHECGGVLQLPPCGLSPDVCVHLV